MGKRKPAGSLSATAAVSIAVALLRIKQRLQEQEPHTAIAIDPRCLAGFYRNPMQPIGYSGHLCREVVQVFRTCSVTGEPKIVFVPVTPANRFEKIRPVKALR